MINHESFLFSINHLRDRARYAWSIRGIVIADAFSYPVSIQETS